MGRTCWAAIGGALLAVGALTGCAGTDAPAPAGSPPPGSAAPTEVPTPVPGPGDADVEPAPSMGPAPVWDEDSRAAALSTATAALGAFARPDLPYEQWWAGFSPFLTSDARTAYVGVDPREIPVSAATGEAVLTAQDSPYRAQVLVPTDAGEMLVVMTRTDGQAHWLVDRIEQAPAR